MASPEHDRSESAVGATLGGPWRSISSSETDGTLPAVQVGDTGEDAD